MKKTFVFIIAFICMVNVKAQFLNEAKGLLNSSNKTFSEKDASDGIKEALVKGTDKSVKSVSATNGYWGNPEIKIPFPQDAKEMETKLRGIGMGKKVDEFNESMNHGAEKASNEAKPIFVAAIKGMTVTDATKIVRGENNAATTYLKRTTSKELNVKFQPIIKASLETVNATKYWSELVTSYNQIPFVKKMNPNLTEYVTGKAIDGLFIMIAKEELNIRKDPLARTSELLKKVFGN